MTSLKWTILILFQLYTLNTFGQTTDEQVDSLVEIYVSQLQKKGIDTICTYKEFTLGGRYGFKNAKDICDDYAWQTPTYIIWLDNGVTFMTKKDNCFDYSTITLSNTRFWKYYFSNNDTINNQELKQPQFVVIKNGEKQITLCSRTHSNYQKIRMIVGRNFNDKHFDDYYFSKKIGTEQNKNINYNYNINTPLKKLQLKLKHTIKIATQKQSFTKTKR